MPTATATEHKRANQNRIQHNTLAEEFYTYYSLSKLQTMLESEPDKLILKNWKVSHKTMLCELNLAIEFVKND